MVEKAGNSETKTQVSPWTGVDMRSGDGRRSLLGGVSAFCLLLACVFFVVSTGNDASSVLAQSTLPRIKEEVSDALKATFDPNVLKLSKRIDESLHRLDKVNLNGVDSAQVAGVVAKATKAFSDVKDAKEIAIRARIAAAKSDVFLIDAEKSKKAALDRLSEASKAAAAATAAANALKLKMNKASTESQHLSKAAEQAHSAYLVSRQIAELLKNKSNEALKQSLLVEKAFQAAKAQALAAKKSAATAAAALAVAIKDHDQKMKEMSALKAAVKAALAIRDAAAAAMHKASADEQRSKSMNSAKLLHAQRMAKDAGNDLKLKIAAAAVASKQLRIALQIRKVRQSAAVIADSAFSKAKDALKAVQLRAAKSSAEARIAEVNSAKASRAANDALKKLLASKQSTLTWPGKKPVLSA
jgi:hypothetical protein